VLQGIHMWDLLCVCLCVHMKVYMYVAGYTHVGPAAPLPST